MKQRSLAALLALHFATAGSAAGQIAPPSTGGVTHLDRLLQELAEGRRVLMIAAHPDDEDSRLIAVLSQGRGVRIAYLALTRGEGGQNLVGEELGVPLGLLRSRELLAARAIDGAEQFFTRAYDFGFTRSREEAEAFWGADEILADVVRIVRRFRPHVIVSVFSGTPRDGHGHHQGAGVLAQEAFEIAGDASRYPEVGSPWQPLKLYRATRFDRGSATQGISIGGIDPRTGLTYSQIAAASRSQHRSQDFGALEPTGPGTTSLGLVRSRAGTGEDEDVFTGVPADTSWLARLADSVRATITVTGFEGAAAPLAGAYARARREGIPSDRVQVLAEAAATAAQIVVDARMDAEELVPGSTHRIDVQVYNAGRQRAVLRGIDVRVPEGWSVSGGEVVAELAPGTDTTVVLSLEVPAAAGLSQPYFLTHPMQGARYDWRDVPDSVKGLPFEPPPAEAVALVEVAGVTVPVRREVTYRYAEQAVGEIRRPVRVVPAVEIRLQPDRVVWSSTDDAPRAFTVTLRQHGTEPVAGEVRVEVDGWPAPPAQRFALSAPGQTVTRTFRVTRPSTVRQGAVTVRGIARADDGREFSAGVPVVEYPHIRPTPYVVAATSEVRVAPITVPPLARVGYVRGASDRVPEALTALGVPLTLLDAATLAQGDLGAFDAIVVGSRAYETDTALVRHNDRLLEYVREGGYLLVQYQQYQFVSGGYAPYPLSIRRPHDRITDEGAPVRVLVPDHPAFTTPHRIGAEDWDGWPQERGLYLAGEWDAAYTPLLEMQDPGLPPMQGAILVAPYGAGTYVYTGISFFRALPEGIPGPTRLFLNLLALGAR